MEERPPWIVSQELQELRKLEQSRAAGVLGPGDPHDQAKLARIRGAWKWRYVGIPLAVAVISLAIGAFANIEPVFRLGRSAMVATLAIVAGLATWVTSQLDDEGNPVQRPMAGRIGAFVDLLLRDVLVPAPTMGKLVVILAIGAVGMLFIEAPMSRVRVD